MTPIVAFCGKAGAGKDTAAQGLCEAFQGQAIAFADPIKRFLMQACELTEAQLWGAEKEVPIPLPKQPWTFLIEMRVRLEQAFASATGFDADHVEEVWSGALWRWAREYIDVSRPVTPRELMQSFGTQCVRQVDPDVWYKLGLKAAQELLAAPVATYRRTTGVWVGAKSDEVVRAVNLVCITDARFRNELLAVKQVGGWACKIVRGERPSSVGAGHRSEVEQDGVPDFWFDAEFKNNDSRDALQDRVAHWFRNSAKPYRPYQGRQA